MNFRDNLNKLMKAKGISAYKLSKETGIPQTTISSWNENKLPNGNNLVKLVQFFEVSADYLLFGKNIGLEKNDQLLLDAYKSANQGIQESIKILLNIQENQETQSEESYTLETG